MSDPTPPAVHPGAQPAAVQGVPAPIYRQISTDFYPWAEIIADLRARSQAGQSLLFQAESGGTCARFVWQAGQLLGGHSGPHELNFAMLMRGLPRARVTLLPLSEEAAAAIWEHRAGSGQALRGTPAQVAAQLSGQTGLLTGSGAGAGVSYWLEGQPRWGSWEPQAAGDSESQEWQFVPLHRPLDRSELELFWRQLLTLTHRRAALDEVWRQVSLQLAARYPVLDPFTREVTVRTGELKVDPAVEADELQPALLSAYSLALPRLGLRLSDLPLERLRQHELWEPSGLQALEERGQA